MDALTEQFAQFAADLDPSDLPAEVVRAASTCLLDTLGCAIGGLDTATTRIARTLTPVDPGPAGGGIPGGRGRVLGAADQWSTGDGAGFLNGVMIRDLDFNDWYPGGHPSDCTGTLLAIAEDAGADGGRLLTAMVVAYEIFTRICAAAPLKARGWDQGFAVAVGTAAAVGNLLRLSQEQIGHAVAIAATAHVPTRATKAGNLSLWKGAATAHAARNALHCARLAAAGMTGPEAAFSGRDGVFELLSGGPFEVRPFGTAAADFFTPAVSFKYWPVCYGLQGPSTAALQLRTKLSMADVRSIVVETYGAAYRLNGSDAPKWDPRNRATADHSIPYAVVRVMEHGTIDEAAFEPEAYLDPAIRPLMARISVREAPDAEAAFPDDVITRLLVTDVHGAEHSIEVVNPPGHEKNPMTLEQVREKFHRLVVPHVGAERSAACAAYWIDVANAGDLAEGFRLLAPDAEGNAGD